ncbi:50S ribosomal protein L24 [Frankia sp. Mgl5]|uniref:Large ribosomal subunit protein uL24 n=3 Tax=Frankiaceae TaxID=74712 RepID=RL24_PARS2|nr:50S ribosomal protein L24 [Parafrankia soli]A8LC45.1 RecName: Full=Large ribosomal subunit protein uL24; AltName: Full=50S ribosomal protein L24 [Frankia sp. EAN1pec]AYF61110.1 50S ribosomal protein L24 [uncultured Frankia sp.]MCK9925760.1 50S ribosomal protein L24 [Frankia sp. Mgl5]TCJ38044.1 50S ribosomal protein L24 [Parafrankia sp. BMG5.11]CAI7975679.1 ribosomal protein L24 (BL23) [Frankia sp. Hr75.2]SQD98769.1 ribosomal protein L24 (BL23) [Parafrankia sp. Ea1.12]
MAGMKIKKGDTVQIVTGKDRGLKGKVIRAIPDQNKVVVEGANRVTRHTRVQQSSRGSQSGGIVTQEAPIHVSNVMIVDPSDGRPTRVGYRFNDDGTKVRISRRTGAEL